MLSCNGTSSFFSSSERLGLPPFYTKLDNVVGLNFFFINEGVKFPLYFIAIISDSKPVSLINLAVDSRSANLALSGVSSY